MIIKRLENEGLAFEGAEASFELHVRRHSPGYAARSGSWTTPASSSIARTRAAREATVKSSRGRRPTTRPPTATGPSTRSTVAAQGAPGVLPGPHGCTSRTTRWHPGRNQRDGGHGHPSIDSRDGARTWSTMGSDTNIIAASAQALADSLEYAIWKSGAELRRRDERHFTTSNGTHEPAPTGGPA